mmetsp:Transcript_41752/g.129981  ORF Transcript_41752/g.129981 Transcript_41752/m.129981 type:complete len:619 (-) Transcript_41752:55-1911(-)
MHECMHACMHPQRRGPRPRGHSQLRHAGLEAPRDRHVHLHEQQDLAEGLRQRVAVQRGHAAATQRLVQQEVHGPDARHVKALNLPLDAPREVLPHALRGDRVPEQRQVFSLPRDEGRVCQVPLVAAPRPAQEPQRHALVRARGHLRRHPDDVGTGTAWKATRGRHGHLEVLVIHRNLDFQAGLGHEHGVDTQDLGGLAAHAGAAEARGALRHGDAAADRLPAVDAEGSAVLVLESDLGNNLGRTALVAVRVEVVCADGLKARLDEVVHLEAFQHLPSAGQDGLVGSPRLVCRVVANDEHQIDGHPIVGDGGAHLVHVRRGLPAAAGDAHNVLSDLLNLHAREIAGDIRHMVCTRILDLVAELLGHAPEAHDTIGVRRLCEREGAVGVGLHNGISHVVPFLVLVVREEAAGALGGALDEVTGAGAHAELVVLVRLPPELVHEDAQRQRTVHHSASDDDVGAVRQGRRDGHRSKIGVRARELHVGHGLAGEHLLAAGLPQLTHALGEVVAKDSTNLHGDLGLLADRSQGVTAAKRVHASGIDDHLDALLLERLDVSANHLDDRTGIAHALVLLPLPREDGHGQLGEVVAHEVVDIPLVDQLVLRQGDVAPHGAEAADPHA